MSTVDPSEPTAEVKAVWGAVASMALCVFVLIASEFLPVSLLTPMARDLAVTEGQAGQAISVSGIFAVITSLIIASWTRNIDRKLVISFMTLLLALSGTIVALAPNNVTLMLGRAVLGITIGGFWSMSTAIVMRLLPERSVAKGLAMLNAGNAIAGTVAAPLGSYLGAWIGWRSAFFLVVPIALLTLIWQWIELPSLPPRHRRAPANPFKLLVRPQVTLGMASMFFLFSGQFALFTYVRPFLENVTKVDVTMLSMILFIIGIAGVAGTWIISHLLGQRLYSLMIIIPVLMAGVALGLISFGTNTAATAFLLMLWGMLGTAAPVACGTWLSRRLTEDAEAGGGLQVATIQFAITAGAASGGMLFDTFGWWSSFTLAVFLLLGSSLTSFAAWYEWEHSK